MSDAMLETISKRLEQLERENRRLKLGALGVLLAVGTLVLMGAASQPGVLEGTKFVLLDGGQQRAVLGMVGDQPALCLYDAAGKKRTAIGASEISLYNDQETERINLGVEPVDGGNGASIGVSDAKGNGRVGLLSCQIGPAIHLDSAKGKHLVIGTMPPELLAEGVTPPPGPDLADAIAALGGEQDPHILVLGAKGNVVHQWPPVVRAVPLGEHR